MSSNPFNTPLALKIKPSPQKWLIIFVPHFFILILVLSLDVFSLGMRLGLVLLIIVLAYYYICLHLRQTLKKSVTEISQDSVKNWYIKTIESNQRKVQLLGTSYISTFLLLVNVMDENKKEYTLLITPDSLLKDEFRRLTVRIKLN